MQHSSQAAEIQLAAQPVSTLRVKATATGHGESRCVTIYSNAGGTPLFDLKQHRAKGFPTIVISLNRDRAAGVVGMASGAALGAGYELRGSRVVQRYARGGPREQGVSGWRSR